MATARVIARAPRAIDAAADVFADFELPPELEATEPPEARGLRRDDVRMLVSDVANETIAHAKFHDLPRWLDAGDLLVVNTSGTLNAALAAETEAGEPFALHLSTQLPGGFWTVELRRPDAVASQPYRGAAAGLTLRLPGDARATLLAPYPFGQRDARDPRAARGAREPRGAELAAGANAGADAGPRLLSASSRSTKTHAFDGASRLWLAALQIPGDWPSMAAYLDRHGAPIRYGYVPRAWPSAAYQTVFATEPGSAEMPSAGRPFTPRLVARLVSRGIHIAPLTLHTGVASLEEHEPPYEERYRVPRATAERVNAARRDGHRVIAVGTTVVRALETVTDARGIAHSGEGWTDLVITPDRPLRAVTSLITGLHEPRATHLAILARVMAPGVRQLARAYDEALHAGYLWHEFGDAHLILGPVRYARS